jgi:hypothetical protein
MQLNAQSIKNKKDLLQQFLIDHKVDVCAGNETWLATSDKFSVPNYSTLRKNRADNSKRGGVCLLVSSGLSFEEINHQLVDELIIIKIGNISKLGDHVVVATLYNPPSSHIRASTLEFIYSLHQNTILVGDLNAHDPLWFSSSTIKSGNTISQMLDDGRLILLNDESATYEPRA